MKLLIAEDNHENREMLRRRLTKVGYDVLCASDGQEAIDIAEKTHPSVILMDISMPIMSGLEATCTLKSTTWGKNIPVIALTAMAFPEDRRACMEAGCDAYATKPINFSSLLNTLDNVTKQAGTDATTTNNQEGQNV